MARLETALKHTTSPDWRKHLRPWRKRVAHKRLRRWISRMLARDAL